MDGHKKKSAVRAGTPATENIKKLSINSILKNGGNVKVYIKQPGELPRATIASEIPPELLSRKLRVERINRSLSIVYEPKSREPMSVSAGSEVFRGTVLVVNLGFNKLYGMSYRDSNEAFVWLMDHKV